MAAGGCDKEGNSIFLPSVSTNSKSLLIWALHIRDLFSYSD